MKDNRDPQVLGLVLLAKKAVMPACSLSHLYDVNAGQLRHVAGRWDRGVMSNDPALHHSRTPQDVPVESDGGGE